MSAHHHVTAAFACAVLLLPRLGMAQSSNPSTLPPRISIGAGVGFAVPAYEDLEATPSAWEADVRLALAKHLLVEFAVGEWRHVFR